AGSGVGAATAGAAGDAAGTSAVTGAGFGNSPTFVSLSCRQEPNPFALVAQLLTMGPATISTMTMMVATAAPIVTARGRDGAGSASFTSGGVLNEAAHTLSRFQALGWFGLGFHQFVSDRLIQRLK